MQLLTILALALSGTVVVWGLQLRSRWLGAWAAALLPGLLFLYFLLQLPGVAGGVPIVNELAWFPAHKVNLVLRLDGLSLLFALLATGIGTLVSIYACAYFKAVEARERGRFVLLVHLFMTAMLGTVLADNMLVMYLFWEWTSLISFALIGFEAHRPEARKAALQSLLLTVAGGLSMFAGMLLYGSSTGSYSLHAAVTQAGKFAELPHAWVIAGLFLAGALTKSAQAPFHFWLPRAMAAPTPASAYLHSATMVKLGLYLLARLHQPFTELAGYHNVLLSVGLLTMLIATLNSLREAEYKALLAHSTVASLGMMVFVLGLPGEAAVTGMLGFLLAHALYKAALFFIAGSVIQGTGVSGLATLSGLRNSFRLTTVAGVLAAFSMAGLPPLFGFIGKELVFELMLDQPLLLAGAVVASAMLIAVAWHAGVRPFLGSVGAVHVGGREARGLAWPSLTLGIVGVLIAGFPHVFAAPLLASATLAGAGTADGVAIGMWHGFTPALIASGAALLLGALFAKLWQALQGRPEWRLAPTSEGGYEFVFRGVLRIAEWCTKALQNGDFRSYVAMVIGATLLGGLWLSFRSGGGTAFLVTGGNFSPAQVLVLGLMSAGALTATVSKGLVATLISVGIVGFGSALIYLLNGAPDLALTQFAVEALVLVVLMALLLRLPLTPRRTRTMRERRLDGLIAAGFGALLFTGLSDMLSHAPNLKLARYFAEQSLPGGHGRNVVNVILVDFRALDTLGELTVIGFAGVIIWALFRRESPGGAPTDGSLILSRMSRVLFWMLMALSLYILWRGHDMPGGGFVGGLVAGMAVTVTALADGIPVAKKQLRVQPLSLVAAGMLAALASGLAGVGVDGSYLSHQWFISQSGFKVGTPLLFDLGVYLVVMGGVTSILFRLYRSERAS